MALSLPQHIQATQAATLNSALHDMGLGAEQAQMLLDWTVPLVLAHLVVLNQRHGTGLVLALVNTQAVDGLWQTLDQAAWIKQAQQHLAADPRLLQMASDRIAAVVLTEIFQLVDAASLGEEGLHELLDGQVEHLRGQAPDWVWRLAGLELLCGQTAVVADQTEALDLAAGIASLNKLVREAAKQHAHQPVLESAMSHHIEMDQTAHPHHNEHAVISLTPQRDAGRLTALLEPLIAVAILAFLYALFSQPHAQVAATPALLSPVAVSTATPETILKPTLVADESQLPPMGNSTDPSETEQQRAIAEAQRTGAQALQFSDNEL